MGQLAGKVAIITGAGSGFGTGMAEAYVREGAKVIVADINAVAGERVAKSLGANAKAVATDVANGSSVQAMVQACVDSFGVPDIVINNAGTTHRNQPMLQVDEQTFDRVFNVNVKSIYHMAHAVVPVMRARGKGGLIINVGSTAGIRPRPGLCWYNSSKGAVNLLSKAMAVAPDKIRVNALCPVMGATALLEDFMGMPDTPENRARFLSTIPLGRLCEPKDMAAAAVFLATDAAEFLTGLEMPIDGGRTI
jgi:3-oxoacyl-[acyl-carrier protein] reductase